MKIYTGSQVILGTLDPGNTGSQAILGSLDPGNIGSQAILGTLDPGKAGSQAILRTLIYDTYTYKFLNTPINACMGWACSVWRCSKGDMAHIIGF